MAATNVKTILKELAEKAKANGSISHREIMDAFADIDVNPETIESFYVKLESLEIEIIEDDDLSLENLEINEKEESDDNADYYNDAEVIGVYVEDPVKAYLRDIGKIPLLTTEEEKKLAERIMAGDREAKNRLSEANLRLVVSIVFFLTFSFVLSRRT